MKSENEAGLILMGIQNGGWTMGTFYQIFLLTLLLTMNGYETSQDNLKNLKIY